MKLHAKRKCDIPVFGAKKFKNLIFVVGGGGGKEFGLAN